MAKFYIIVGPSGVGKSELQKKVITDLSLEHIVRSVSATTRKPRDDEKHGTDYFFYDENTFFQMVENREFLEYKKYSEDHYGTPKKFTDENLAKGNDVIGVIEVKGAHAIMNHYSKHHKRDTIVSIFIYPENFKDLVLHLENRDIKSDYTKEQIELVKEKIKKRMTIAMEEIETINDYDHRICMKHNHFDEAYGQLHSIIMAERAREPLDTKYKTKFVQNWREFCKTYK